MSLYHLLVMLFGSISNREGKAQSTAFKSSFRALGLK